jgi:hypothetical protein
MATPLSQKNIFIFKPQKNIQWHFSILILIQMLPQISFYGFTYFSILVETDSF